MQNVVLFEIAVQNLFASNHILYIMYSRFFHRVSNFVSTECAAGGTVEKHQINVGFSHTSVYNTNECFSCPNHKFTHSVFAVTFLDMPCFVTKCCTDKETNLSEWKYYELGKHH